MTKWPKGVIGRRTFLLAHFSFLNTYLFRMKSSRLRFRWKWNESCCNITNLPLFWKTRNTYILFRSIYLMDWMTSSTVKKVCKPVWLLMKINAISIIYAVSATHWSEYHEAKFVPIFATLWPSSRVYASYFNATIIDQSNNSINHCNIEAWQRSITSRQLADKM